MLGLEKSLLGHELIVLRIIGEWWELDLTGMDKEQCAAALVERLQQIDMREELLYLQREEAAAMQAVAAAGGRVPVAVLGRTYGLVRPMGPGALEREEPWLDPQSPVEALWYRGFLYQAFDETADGMVEFFYVPDALGGEIESEAEVEIEIEKGDRESEGVVAPGQFEAARHDVATTVTSLLALAQVGQLDGLSDRRDLLWTIAAEAGWQGDGRPKRAAVTWLQQSENDALQAVWTQWLASAWNALHHLPDIVCEGSNWENDPAAPRRVLLDNLPSASVWIEIAPLVAHIKQHEPDFQRPNGNYDNWYIREAETEAYLAGFDSWEQVEGRLLRYVLTRPMQWLGMIDVSEQEDKIRPTPNLIAWRDQQPLVVSNVDLPIIIQPNAAIIVPLEASRYHRFQLTRVAELQPVTAGSPWMFHMTAQSLAQAKAQGITPDRVLNFLSQIADRPLPASTRRAIERWQEHGTEGRVQQTAVLSVGDASIIEKLRQNDKTRPYIGESLGTLAVIIRGDETQFRQIVAQLGLLLE